MHALKGVGGFAVCAHQGTPGAGRGGAGVVQCSVESIYDDVHEVL